MEEHGLEDEMYAAYETLKKEHGYNAVYFLRMLREHGGVQTARRLLRDQGGYSDGFLKLVSLGRLDLSVEAYVLRPEYRHLFSGEELDQARRRLKAADFDVERWEEQPWA